MDAQRLPDTIFVLNSRFVPRSAESAFLYGVVQHVMQAADFLKRRGVNIGFLLYERNDQMRQPSIADGVALSHIPTSTVRFNFNMPIPTVTDCFENAIDNITACWAENPIKTEVMLYFQSSSVLPYLPMGIPGLITHHSPFVSDVIQAMGKENADRAFGWDHDKADHLFRTQQAGIEILKRREDIQCAEISPIQRRHLIARGISADRIHDLPQPVQSRQSVQEDLPPRLLTILEKYQRVGKPLAVTVVSRLDYFKNIELFVEASCMAIRRGFISAGLVIGGADDDPERDRLTSLIPEDLRQSIFLLPKISHNALISEVFPRLKSNAVFICTSRFDLTPYTVLEAICAGVTSIVPRSKFVGDASILPDSYLYSQTPEGICAWLEIWPASCAVFEPFRKKLLMATSEDAFCGTLSKIWNFYLQTEQLARSD